VGRRITWRIAGCVLAALFTVVPLSGTASTASAAGPAPTVVVDLAAPSWATLARGSAIAHRGGPCCAPENTMQAFRNAYGNGVPAIEFDVRILGDGTLAVIHDATVDRTTAATGSVTGFTAAEWRALGLPLYRDVLREFGGKVLLLIEPKVPGAARGIMDGITAYGIPKSTVVINSFQRDDLVRAESRGFWTMWLNFSVADVVAGRGEWVGPRQDRLTTAMVADAHRRGLRVAPWTITTAAQTSAVLAKGVDAVITDRPPQLATAA
jgi:glycerophosphoryl diester phosphodiesterase